MTSGYVYLMESGGRYKIGKADNVERRLETFRTADPQIRVVRVIPTSDPFWLEAALHRKYAHCRIWPDHEWFMLSPREVSQIEHISGSIRFRRSRRWRFRGRSILRSLRLIPLVIFIILYLDPQLRALIHVPKLTNAQFVLCAILAWIYLLSSIL